MGLKTNNCFMIESLTSLLADNEHLYSPFYGCLVPEGFFKTAYDLRFGFFGRTDPDLLIALLSPLNGKKIMWTIRVPLDIKEVKIKKSFIMKQYIVKLFFNEGNPCKIRFSKKLLIGDFINQNQNVTEFLYYLEQYIK